MAQNDSMHDPKLWCANKTKLLFLYCEDIKTWSHIKLHSEVPSHDHMNIQKYMVVIKQILEVDHAIT